MTIKTRILAAAAILTLAAPAAALAQPFYGAPVNSHRDDVRRVEVRHDDFGRGELGRGDFRRIEREREFRRAEELRRLRWEREHDRYSYGYDRPYYR